MRALLAVGGTAVALLLDPAAQDGEIAARDDWPAAIVGAWEGTMAQTQVGDCRMSGEPHKTALAIELTPEGTLVAGERPVGMRGPVALKWRGRLDGEWHVRFEGPGGATCGDRKREYTIEYRGGVKRDGSKWTLELTGDDRACPEMGCVFRRTYGLTRVTVTAP